MVIFTYEHLRSKKEGGGVAVSALKVLKLVFVTDGGEHVEALTIDIHVKNMTVIVTSAYGPQETSKIENEIMFLEYLNEEAQRSKACGKGFILQGDHNAILGPEFLPGDCHAQNINGKLFAGFLKDNNFVCVNSLPLTKGVITRSQVYLGVEKKLHQIFM